MQQATFEGLAFAAKQKLTRSEKFLTERATVVPWAALEAIIEPHYPKVQPPWRPVQAAGRDAAHLLHAAVAFASGLPARDVFR